MDMIKCCPSQISKTLLSVFVLSTCLALLSFDFFNTFIAYRLFTTPLPPLLLLPFPFFSTNKTLPKLPFPKTLIRSKSDNVTPSDGRPKNSLSISYGMGVGVGEDGSFTSDESSPSSAFVSSPRRTGLAVPIFSFIVEDLASPVVVFVGPPVPPNQPDKTRVIGFTQAGGGCVPLSVDTVDTSTLSLSFDKIWSSAGWPDSTVV
mmetsp:Transcript_48780/g.62597  ORF Transcript_48780/g.62597 Transcript_48780/m.62597 type:complete len:204 (+) Transcript_48780:1613-2224(+)